MKRRFRRVKDGDTLLVYTVNRWACCDCGLVHTMTFKSTKTALLVRVRRNESWTKASRRRKVHRFTPSAPGREAADD